MEYIKIKGSDLNVSKICLGSMTWGQQNSEAEGHDQIDYALTQGINFIDTAELYSVPGRKETQGSTERIIGTWLKKTGKRSEIVLATKVTGPSPGLTYISPNLGFSKPRIQEAIDASLQRLQTDYVDIYQLHWPERKTNCFGHLGFTYDAHDPWKDNFEEAITTLYDLMGQGKIRYWGLSNETPWGVMRVFQLCDRLNIPRPITIQNPYNLLNRSFEVGLAEISIRENLGLLAYSPLAFGLLSGKYHLKTDLPTDRINQFKNLARYNGSKSFEATALYMDIAHKFNISPTQLALAFVNAQAFVTSNIIGATTMAQLKENIASIKIILSEEMLKDIQAVHAEISNPAP